MAGQQRAPRRLLRPLGRRASRGRWPRPARRVVGWCANSGITPNMVTITGLLLVLAATWLFAHGAFASGLVCGWIMTLLDTVD